MTQFYVKIVLSLRIKYDDGRNWNNCVIRTISIVGFDSTKKHNSYLCLIFLLRIYSIQYIICFESKIKYNYNKNQNNCVMRTILFVASYSIENHNCYLGLIFFFLTWHNFNYIFALSLRIKDYNSKNQNILIVVYIRSNIYGNSELLFLQLKILQRKITLFELTVLNLRY